MVFPLGGHGTGAGSSVFFGGLGLYLFISYITSVSRQHVVHAETLCLAFDGGVHRVHLFVGLDLFAALRLTPRMQLLAGGRDSPPAPAGHQNTSVGSYSPRSERRSCSARSISSVIRILFARDSFIFSMFSRL